MTGLEHAILATGLLFVFYKWGEWTGRREKVEDIIETTLIKLEDSGFIITETNEDGQKELMPVQKKC